MTLTITEKGYCHHSGTSSLDRDSAIAEDIAAPERPTTAVRFLALLLEHRRRRGGAGITLASCDNVSGNGDILRAVLHEYAAEAFPDLPAWLEANVAFPNSMVDRIVPTMDAASRSRLEDALGAPDALGVVAEPFRQWVIEDRFAASRPPLEAAGVQVVPDIAIFEHMKHRLLNGLQSAFAEIGRLAGFATTCEAVRDPDLRAWAEGFLALQAETLDCPPREDLAVYAATSLTRLANPHIRHSLNQIASDASYKLPQRVLAPAAELAARGRSVSQHAAVVAAWIHQAGGQTPDAVGIRVS